jgi:hypothetical protein
MKILFATAAAALLLGACSSYNQCVQPDPVEPTHSSCWDKGVDCGTGIQQAK